MPLVNQRPTDVYTTQPLSALPRLATPCHTTPLTTSLHMTGNTSHLTTLHHTEHCQLPHYTIHYTTPLHQTIFPYASPHP
ncbi:hypothetical protein E2C01_045473 [Portunus trituberculatus]|uniref:Uncharacterized protein n=1 Tax=Portunus trituberculatus TaxID=210409 RepID=A0A5B7G2Z6_PORTR|nr:hypothetical protein [Portunus trituberculatus]